MLELQFSTTSVYLSLFLLLVNNHHHHLDLCSTDNVCLLSLSPSSRTNVTNFVSRSPSPSVEKERSPIREVVPRRDDPVANNNSRTKVVSGTKMGGKNGAIFISTASYSNRPEVFFVSIIYVLSIYQILM